MKRFLPILLIVFSAITSQAGNPVKGGIDFNAEFIDANRLMLEKNWTKSINTWQKLLEAEPNNANINYKIGYCLLQTANSKKEALTYLEAAVMKKLSNNYDPDDPNESKAPVIALYYLGKAQALNMKLDEAIVSYQTLEKKLGKKHIKYQECELEIKRCEEAKLQMANPKNYIITNIGPVVNKETNEYSPVLSLDESTMFFTSRRMRADSTNAGLSDMDTGEFKEDVYASYKTVDGVWSEPEILKELNTDYHEATISVSPDGQNLFLYSDYFGDGRLLESRLIGETWSTPTLLGSDINTEAWETHATISADGNTLYFVSDRAGGIGKRDIYKCVKLPNGEWSRALNIGTTINTEFEEDAPFLTADGKTLYFSSTGHNSMGEFDIFVSKLGDDGEWGAPVNMGYPLNTVDTDVFFVPMADGRRAYYSSSKDGGYGLRDIYLVDMPDITNETNLAVLKGFIIAPEGEELPEDLRILVTNLKSNEVTEYRPRKRDGGFLAILTPCTPYHVEYFKGSEMIKDDDINVPCDASFKEIEKEVYILPFNIAKTEPEQPKEEPKVEPKVEPKIEAPKEEPEVEVQAPEEIKNFEYDPKDPINRQYIEGKAFAQFSRYFVYDFNEFGAEEKEFSGFIKDINKIMALGKKPVITVESSASNVPSSKFKNNDELTAARNKTAEDQVRTALTKAGKKEGVDYTFGEPIKLVQGKKYENDAKKNRLIYEQYQYIKIKVQG
jgi:tetratricopeptide (TPR) repeat protein